MDLQDRYDFGRQFIQAAQQILGALQGIDRTREFAACLLDMEIRLSHSQQRIIGCRLHVGLPRTVWRTASGVKMASVKAKTACGAAPTIMLWRLVPKMLPSMAWIGPSCR